MEEPASVVGIWEVDLSDNTRQRDHPFGFLGAVQNAFVVCTLLSRFQILGFRREVRFGGCQTRNYRQGLFVPWQPRRSRQDGVAVLDAIQIWALELVPHGNQLPFLTGFFVKVLPQQRSIREDRPQKI